MAAKPLRTDGFTVELYDQNEKLATFSKDVSRLGGDSVQFQTQDFGRMEVGGRQGNPMSQYLPSDVVTPHTVWLTINPLANFALNLIWAVKEVMDALESDEEDAETRARVSPRTKDVYQIVDFNEFLPEEV